MNLHMSPQDRKITQQRERIEELEEELRQLKTILVPPFTFPLEWRLTATQRRLLIALYKTPGCLTHTQCFTAMDSKAIQSDSLLNVQIMKLRRRLTPFGVVVKNHWGVGYEIPAASKVIIKAAIRGDQ